MFRRLISSGSKVIAPSVVLCAATLLSLTPAMAERRCGWIENPTPGNYWVSDSRGQWVLAAQGGAEVKGMDLMPDFTLHDFVATNGAYGYACGCVDGAFTADKVATEITRVRQLPVAVCKKDTSLPKPGG
jgi:hypothetical protein